MSRLSSPRAVAFALALAACGGPKEETASGIRIDLLGRRPDTLFELPSAILPQGDVAGTLTWGASEGAGWSHAERRLATSNAPYLETSQATASLLLPATRPAARELALALWCARALDAEPARVSVKLNGVELAKEGLVVGRDAAELRLHAPELAWKLGPNELELAVPTRAGASGSRWDTLALARVSYGPEARVVFAPDGSLRFADGTGARYTLALATGAALTIAGTASGAGELHARLGVLDPGTGDVALDEGPAASFPAQGGAFTGELPLTPRAGRVRVLDLDWSGPGGAALALTRLEARERESPVRPPIVFVSIDTFAAQHLATYGYSRATSPALDAFARDAVLFERCIANAPWTLPSYLSVLSGLYPRSHSVPLRVQAGAALAPQDWWHLASNRWTLAEALRARGYRTGGFVDTQWLAPVFGVGQGFDVFNGEGALAKFEDPHAHIEHIVRDLVPSWLATCGPDRPPFLFLHALDAHGPYLPDAPFRDAFTAKLPPPRTLVPAGSDNQTYRWMPWWMSRTLLPDEKLPEAREVPLEEVVARYDEVVLKVDTYLGQLFALLRERGLYDDAMIVVTGDHGEFFGPGMYGHGLMKESVLHVPLFLKLPRNARGGTKVSAPVALVDVYPTLLELAGVPADPARLHGTSLLAHLDGSSAGAERALFTEGGHIEQYALTQGCWRLIEEFPGSESSEASLLSHPRVPDEWLRANAPELLTKPLTKELLKELLARPGFDARVAELRKLVAGPYVSLFDLCHDPEERHDLAGEQPAILERLKVALEAEKARSRRAQAEARLEGARTSLSPEALRALEGLGYGGEADEEPPPQAPR